MNDTKDPGQEWEDYIGENVRGDPLEEKEKLRLAYKAVGEKIMEETGKKTVGREYVAPRPYILEDIRRRAGNQWAHVPTPIIMDMIVAFSKRSIERNQWKLTRTANHGSPRGSRGGHPRMEETAYARKLRNRPEWPEQRAACLAKDGHLCRTCASPHDLQAHHRRYDHFVEPGSLDGLPADEVARRLAAEQDDLTTLCDDCHWWYEARKHAPKKVRCECEKLLAPTMPSRPPAPEQGAETEVDGFAKKVVEWATVPPAADDLGLQWPEYGSE